MAMMDYDPDRRCTALEALNFPFFSRISVYKKQLALLQQNNSETLPCIRISSKGIVSKV